MTKTNKLKFIIPSLFGLLLFLVPVPFTGQWTIGVGILAEFFLGLFSDVIPLFMSAILLISIVMTLIARLGKPAWIMNSPFLKSLFYVGGFWLIMRILGGTFAVMVLLEAGPAFIWDEFTGGTVLYELIPVLTTWFFFAGLMMPLLLEFGLMDYIGTVVRKVMRPVFKLPGRSSIDAVASWMGSGTVGVLITTKQYESGYYTKREAAVIATNFSVASIAFSLVVISFIGLEHMFVQFYVTVVVAGLLAAIICPRIPPLSKKKNTYFEEAGRQISEEVPTGKSPNQWAFEKAVAKASEVKSASRVIQSGFQNVIDIWFGLIPLVMALGTIALVIAEYTNFFVYLSYPLVPLLELMRIPEAQAAAPAMIVGFADMFLPAVVGSGIESELTRFIVAALSLTQLVYMSEIGILLLRSKIPLNLLDLIIIFIQRTLITLPIITLMAHLLFF
ncbi:MULTISPECIES: YjiH family protein [Alteribacter]|uniref:YjiH family protein n=1 Tax=Alteribacter keqinensis TaxID=2483800 RepID=A0A3M7TR66_9BACI|nr:MULTISPECIES: YjiH family protein [Alteribacter]MBM7095753.1 YjiH family protein [Alteribacter salitolerans]RNA68058.1 YjiH family protein [Alteribacter keqinensis]